MILDGKKLADEITEDLKQRATLLKSKGFAPRLLIVTASGDPASRIYVRNKVKRCEEIGIEVEHLSFDKLTKVDMEFVKERNIPTIIQMPFESDELKMEDLGDYITAENDVDGFINSKNVVALATGRTPEHEPCTPKGIIRLLDEYHIPIEGKSVCVIGRSNIVGRPLAMMLEQRNATVSLCHSKTSRDDLIFYATDADITVSATGMYKTISVEEIEEYFTLLDKDDFFEGSTFVDVGMNRDENGKLCGDLPEDLKEHGDAYTPVPGGVGPMTVAMLMQNVIDTYERKYIRS